jgi:hypothetical protein
MKVYNILATVVVEDNLSESKIQLVCRENIEKAIMEDFYIGNCVVHYELTKTIDFPDLPPLNDVSDEIYEEKYDAWMEKSQEVIDGILVEMRNP